MAFASQSTATAKTSLAKSDSRRVQPQPAAMDTRSAGLPRNSPTTSDKPPPTRAGDAVPPDVCPGRGPVRRTFTRRPSNSNQNGAPRPSASAVSSQSSRRPAHADPARGHGGLRRPGSAQRLPPWQPPGRRGPRGSGAASGGPAPLPPQAGVPGGGHTLLHGSGPLPAPLAGREGSGYGGWSLAVFLGPTYAGSWGRPDCTTATPSD